MAKCEKRPIPQYVLVLSEREASCLRDLLDNRSDWSIHKDKEIADINHALSVVGVVPE